MKHLTFALILAGIVFTAYPADAAQEPDFRKLTVCISRDMRNYNLMIAEPSSILRRIGIEVHWHRMAGCPADAIHVHMLKTAPAGLPAKALGCAHPLEGRDADVYMDRIEAAVVPARVASLTGYVVAHEIVHLLEGEATRHADQGIMRTRWTGADIQIIAWGWKLTADDIDLIHAGMRERQARADAE